MSGSHIGIESMGERHGATQAVAHASDARLRGSRWDPLLGRGRLERIHAAASLKLDAPVDEERRRVQVADDFSGGMDLNGGLCTDVAVNHSPPHDDGGHVDLRVDVGSLPDDEGILAANLALEEAVDAHAPLEMELSFEFGPPPEQGGNFRGRELLFHRLGRTRRRAFRATSPAGPRPRSGWVDGASDRSRAREGPGAPKFARDVVVVL